MPRKKIHENGWDKTPEAAEYRRAYNAEHYARIEIAVPREARDDIDRIATAAGISRTQLIMQAVEAWKEKNGIK
ncbi:MAG: ribbon-helix-helix protein, CopG family [Oscillospiraceae bacterium]|nr:ribbon-helix-helix protein, CopG family [Oscillospiraceae bacterium]